MPSQWRPSADFAEVAETLGINTDQVLSMAEAKLVIFSPVPAEVMHDGTPVFAAVLVPQEPYGVLSAHLVQPAGTAGDYARAAEDKIRRGLLEEPQEGDDARPDEG